MTPLGLPHRLHYDKDGWPAWATWQEQRDSRDCGRLHTADDCGGYWGTTSASQTAQTGPRMGYSRGGGGVTPRVWTPTTPPPHEPLTRSPPKGGGGGLVPIWSVGRLRRPSSKGQVWARNCAPAAPACTRPSLPSQFLRLAI